MTKASEMIVYFLEVKDPSEIVQRSLAKFLIDSMKNI